MTADETELRQAARALLARLDDLTTAEFSLGGERAERERLRQALDQVQDVEFAPEDDAEQPDMDQLDEWLDEGYCEALDGCIVEPDGTCPHGQPSWLLHLGLI